MDKCNGLLLEKQLKVTRQPQGKKYVPGFRVAGAYLAKMELAEGDHVEMVADGDLMLIRKVQPTRDTLAQMIDKNPALLSLIRKFNLSPEMP